MKLVIMMALIMNVILSLGASMGFAYSYSQAESGEQANVFLGAGTGSFLYFMFCVLLLTKLYRKQCGESDSANSDAVVATANENTGILDSNGVSYTSTTGINNV
jgi:hypothetical protein